MSTYMEPLESCRDLAFQSRYILHLFLGIADLESSENVSGRLGGPRDMCLDDIPSLCQDSGEDNQSSQTYV
jgi:hypothetical protein